jgi:FkbM family methyltransferase
MRQTSDVLASIINLSRRTVVVDIGANPVDGHPPYKAMLSRGLCDVIGLEPQVEALAKLNQRKGPQERYLPYAVGDGQMHTLHVCQASGMTSLLEPDPKGLDLFPEFQAWGAVKHRHDISTVRFDDIGEIERVDLLKIDVQGAELSVFQGGRRKLSEAVAIQSEVSFMPLYKNQPTFGDVDIELRGMGFVPHMFAELNRRMILPLRTESPFDHLNQVMEADIVYVRDFREMERMSTDQLGHLAMIAHHVYRSFDLAVRCLVHLVERGVVPGARIQDYRDALRSGA